ncbi:DBIRD complex subunit ZNF326 isoform X1 [Lepisosteus oculatus]|uniref:DBIRD complex subunit ZNF326 isoform X1 n=2 Tax=Lepisosteus oculatus TaxID=7918 RepID=UPI00371FE76B
MIRGNGRGRFGGPAPRPLEPYNSFERYSEKEDLMTSPLGSGDMSHGCSQRRYAGPVSRPFDSFEGNSLERFGPYESYDSGSSRGSRDLYRSGFGSSFGGGFDSSFPNNQFDNDVSSWESSYLRSGLRSGFMDNAGRGGYSSYGSLSSPHMKPAPVGSRGRGMPAYPQNKFGGRSSDLGGPTTVRGRGRGPMGQFGNPPPGFQIDYQHQPAFRGVKRKMMAPSRPNTFVKKQKLTKTGLAPKGKMGTNSPSEAGGETDDGNNGSQSEATMEEEKQRKIEARREKQRRRREKNNEKYGDGYRLAFTCTFCKFRTFEEKDIENHFESPSHKETLDYIQKQAKFDDGVINFLHESMVNKFRKTVSRKLNNNHPEQTLEEIHKELMEGVTEEDYMRKVEVIHCVACRAHVPAVLSSVQQHLKSSDHQKNKVLYKEQLKKESVLTATSILNNPIVKARYEKYIKGEDPFEVEAKDEPVEGSQQDSYQNDADLTQFDDGLGEDSVELEGN